jgi:collagenase-like PrtC family protease
MDVKKVARMKDDYLVKAVIGGVHQKRQYGVKSIGGVSLSIRVAAKTNHRIEQYRKSQLMKDRILNRTEAIEELIEAGLNNLKVTVSPDWLDPVELKRLMDSGELAEAREQLESESDYR